MSRDRIENHFLLSQQVLASLKPQLPVVEEIVSLCERVIKQGGGIFSCGNGGSACEAMHLTEELVARYKMHRPGIKAFHLCDSGILTCWANDYAYDDVFSRQVEALMGPKDLLFALTSSGNSPNLIKAMNTAKSRGISTIALSGKGGGEIATIADISLVVASENTAQVQECQLSIIHVICSELEIRLFG